MKVNKLNAIKIAFIYLIIGYLWILLSDFIVDELFYKVSPKSISIWQSYKGLFFISATALLLYFLVVQFYKNQLETADNFTMLFKSNPSPMLIFEVDTYKILNVNQAAIEMYQYSYDEFLNISIMDIRPIRLRNEIKTIISQLGYGGSMQHESIHCKKNGDEFYIRAMGNPINFNGKEARLVTVVNIDEQVRSKLVAEERLLTLREIARFHAHEFRGPVSNLLGLTELLSQDQLNDDVSKEVVQKINIVAKQIDAINSDLLDKSSKVKQ
tara:strand:+ start:652 stop:1458 length:807 start_codon:yes stop_codon:yes gene_type:complete